MATPAEIQAELDSTAQGKVAIIQQSRHTESSTYDEHYVVGLSEPQRGRSRWCVTTAAGSAADQAAEIFTALRA